MRAIVGVLLLVASLSGCDGSPSQQATTLQAENAALRKELEETKRQLEDLKNGSPGLLAQAEQSASKGDWAAVKKLTDNLLSRYPTSAEASRAKQLQASSEAALAKAAKEAEAAEARKAEAARRERAEAERRVATSLGKMQKKVDKVENITWYQDRSSPAYTNVNGIYLYIGDKGVGRPFLRFRAQYAASDWLFIQSIIVIADGRRFDFDGLDFERDNDSRIWEWYDTPARSKELEMVNAVISSKSATLRYEGKQYRKDREITASEKAAFRNVLDAYKALGGT